MRPPVLTDVALEGRRALLRPVALGDVDAAFELLHERDPVTEWLVWDGPETREELVPWYGSWATRSAQGATYHLAVVERASGEFAGAISVRLSEAQHEGELGYWLGERYWRRGLGTEMVALTAHLGFQWLEAYRLHARVFEGNLASEGVLAKNRFVEEPEGHDLIEKRGVWRKRRCFALLRTEWRARRAAVRPRRAAVRIEMD